jgi:acyl-CoA thioester hydrolase
MKTVETRVRVRYAETDQMGVVYHANYLVWMEVGRVELCRAKGISYREMEAEDGVLLAVASVNCRFSHPARYDDEIAIETQVVKAHPRMVIFGYTLRRIADGQLVATGETRHVFCSRELQPRRLPARYFPVFGIEQRG